MNTGQENEILEAVSKGDKDAFRRLFDIWYKPMCVYAMNYIDSFDDAEDIAQNILALFWMKYSKERFEGSLKAYLFSSVRNDCVRCLKRQRKYLHVDALPEEGEGEAFVAPEAAEEEAYGEEDYRRLMEEIEKLPEQARRIFTMVVLEDKKYKEVAALLGISVNTVKTSLARSFKRLRSSLGLIVTILLH